ncbi:hypothetical protein DFP72DRAFT_1062569 [Ephemerocybe angulata]|uniref:Uncharacterized protein n=1 Tax=Ephemerocybe angulata TaxID=980116 RepID=A0A8H6IBJ8_9AGAR|nr:hypothetical protein DFP72DRAFT_1062569 [Tulosesus angulatus]
MAHYKFIETFEEPERFSRAMENPRGRGGVEEGEGEGVDGGRGFGGVVLEGSDGGDAFPPPEPRTIPPFQSPASAPPTPTAPHARSRRTLLRQNQANTELQRCAPPPSRLPS